MFAEKLSKAFLGGHLSALQPIGIADTPCSLLFGAVQEHRKQLTAVSSYDLFKFFKLCTIVRFDIAEGRDY